MCILSTHALLDFLKRTPGVRMTILAGNRSKFRNLKSFLCKSMDTLAQMAERESHRCDNCGQEFANRYQLGPHRRMCYRHQAPPQFENFSANSDDGGGDSSTSAGSAPSAASAHEQRVNILSLARRPPAPAKWGIQKNLVYSSTKQYDPHYTADYTEVNMLVRSSRNYSIIARKRMPCVHVPNKCSCKNGGRITLQIPGNVFLLIFGSYTRS